MTDDRSLERAARSFIEDGPTRAPDRTVEAALLAIESTPQERDLRIPWRLPTMTNPVRVAMAAVVGVLVVGVAVYALGTGPRFGVATPSSTASPTSTPSATTTSSAPLPSPKAIVPEVPLTPGEYYELPFGVGGMDVCYGQAGCTENPADDAMRFILTIPAGWIGGTAHVIYAGEGKTPPDGAGLVISRGGGLYAEPCGDEPPPNIAVGPTVDNFVDALVAHPKLDVTTPVEVSLAGYTGKYLELQVPSDLSACGTSYFPWEPGIFAQGPGSRWHLWVLDVHGIRVVIQTTDYVGTSAERQAQLRAIVESIVIEP